MKSVCLVLYCDLVSLYGTELLFSHSLALYVLFRACCSCTLVLHSIRLKMEKDEH